MFSEQQIFMEPLPDRRYSHYIPFVGPSQEDEEGRPTCTQSNICEIIDLLQTTQDMTEITLIQYSAGGARLPKRPIYRRINSKNTTTQRQIPTGVIIAETNYAYATSHLLHHD